MAYKSVNRDVFNLDLIKGLVGDGLMVFSCTH